MTRITILEQKLVKLRESKSKVSKVYNNLKESRIDQLSRVIHKYFEEVLEKGDTIKVSDSRVEFTRPQEGYKYSKDILTLYFKQENWRDVKCNAIETSFYSTTDNSEFELKRMILIGKVGQIVLDFYDDILGAYNKIISDFEDRISDKRKQIYDLDKEITEVNNQIKVIEKENLLTVLESKGIEFELPEDKSYHNLPSLDVAFDHQIRYVLGLRILGKTKSGKSADIEVTRVGNTWDSKKEEYVINNITNTYEKVRMKNIERFLHYYSERISAS